VPGQQTTNYKFYFKVYNYNGVEITSATGITWTRTATAARSANTVTGSAPAYSGGYWSSTFALPAHDKYGITISAAGANYSGRAIQVVNFAASSAFTVSPGLQPEPGNVTWDAPTPADNVVSLSWANPGTNETGVLVLRNTSPITNAPVNGATYTVGSSIGTSRIVYNSLGTGFTDGTNCIPAQRLVNGQVYYYKAFPYNVDNIYTATDTGVSSTPADSTAPSAVTGITVTPGDRKNTINWTNSPECDFTGVTIRYSTVSFPTSRTGADGSLLAGTKLGGTYGGPDSFLHQGLVNGTPYYYTIWAHDDEAVYNWSPGASPAAYSAPSDTEAPGQITGLAVVPGSPTAFTITMQWSAPADSGFDVSSGNATKYYLKYYDQPITDVNWDAAWLPGGEWLPQPVAVGTLQSYQISGLSPLRDYYFAIRTVDEVNNMSAVSNSATGTTLCNEELTSCDQCHQMPPTDGLPGQHPRATGNIGKHSLPIHAGAGQAEVCNVCHADGNVWRNNTTLYDFNHQNYLIDINGPGMIGNKDERDTLTGGTFVMYTEIVYKFQGYSTGVGYKQKTGYCALTYCHGGGLSSPRWGIDDIVCGEYCHETPPATGKHVKHYHPGQHYINFAPTGTLVSGYTLDDGASGWSGPKTVATNGLDPATGGNTDPRYATYIESADAQKTFTLPAGTWYATVCVGDSNQVMTNQTVRVSGDGGATWVTLVDNFDCRPEKQFDKAVDIPFTVVGANNMILQVGNGTDPTRVNFMIVNSTPEAPKTNNTILQNTSDEYGFSCGKCHTADNTQAGHTGHVNGAVIPNFRRSEVHFDANSFPKNPLGNYTALFDAVSSYTDGQGFEYTLGSQCANLYCHGNTLNAGGSNNTPTWDGGYIDVAGASLCGACHEAGYGDSTPDSNMDTGSHDKHVNRAFAYRLDCFKCHEHTVAPRDTETGEIAISDKTHHVNGDVDAVFDPNDNTMKFGRYSTANSTCYSVYCHSNGLLENNQPYWATTYREPVWGSGSKTCNYCHGTSTTDGHPAYANLSTTPNSHAMHREANGIGCSTCHHDTTRDNGLSVYTTVQPSLHVNGTRDVTFDPAVTGGSFNPSNLECSNTYCHGPTAPPRWGQDAVACGDCHGNAPNYGAHSVHNQGNYGNISTVDANKSAGNVYDFDCRFCHFQRTHGSGEMIPGVQSAEVNFNTIDAANAYNNTGGSYTGAGTVRQDSNGWHWSGGTCSNILCHSDGRGGPPNVMPNWTSAIGSLNCSGCHGGHVGATYGDIQTGKHSKHTNSTVYRKTCGDCHAATTVGDTLSDTSMHVNGSVNVVINPVWGGAFSQGDNTCDNVACHSNGDPTAWNGAGSDFHVMVNWTSSSGTTCTTCHSDSYYPAGDGVRAASQTLSHNHRAHVTTYGPRIGCTNCHNDTAATNSSLQPAIPTLHNDNIKNVVYYTPFFNMTGSANGGNGYWGEWDAPTSGNCTVICHSDGNGNNPNWFPNWSTVGGTYGCGACHGTTGTLTTGSHALHATTSNFDCGVCHSTTAVNNAPNNDGETAISATGYSANHVNGVKDVVLSASAGGSWNSGAQTCTTTDATCHNTGSPVWGTTATCVDCHGVTSAETDDFTYGNATMATVNTTEYTTSGHGRTTPYPYTTNAGAGMACEDCHTNTFAHNDAANPFRLMSTATIKPSQPDTLCNGCHVTEGNHDFAHVAQGTWGWTPKCVDCHDPHGDKGGVTTTEYNGAMVQAAVSYTASNTYGVPGTTEAVDFPANYAVAQAGNLMNWSSFVWNSGANKGICRVCHTQGTTTYFTRSTYSSHNSDQGACLACHQHGAGFQPSACDACHGYPPNTGDAKLDNAGAVGSHSKHVTQLTIACSECHGHDGSGAQHNESGVSGGYSGILTPANVDVDLTSAPDYHGGVKSYDGTPGGWSTLKTCTNIGCHYGASKSWDCQ